MNQLAVIGRLCRDHELKSTANKKGVYITNTIAVNRLFRSENGQNADFIPFVAWGKTARLLNDYCKKGDQVGLTGKIQSRQYQNKKDETVYTVEMLVQEIQFLEAKDKPEPLPEEVLAKS